ncbi:MAG TPA: TatD family deoxyribonuclease [Desulfobulbus sp.]|nr:TatD family deoxyribonuclease [Desulfobulbus sp.]
MPQANASKEIHLVDSHCHLDMEAFDQDLDLVIDQAHRAGVDTILTIGVDRASSEQAVELAGRYPSVYAAVGIHPHDAIGVTDADFDKIVELSINEKVVGYGEIGLDYARMYSPKEVQQQVFSRQLGLAKELHLPVIIHDREAHEDTLKILRSHAPFPAGGVMHCFSGDTELADRVIELGFFVSIPGIVTFKNAKSLQQVAQELPLHSMLIETDGPFLAPVPFRGKRNTPALLQYTAAKIARLRDTPLLVIAERTSDNARTLFNLPPAAGTE